MCFEQVDARLPPQQIQPQSIRASRGLYLLCRDARAEQGMNCYIETHVGRISEDPEAFVKV